MGKTLFRLEDLADALARSGRFETIIELKAYLVSQGYRTKGQMFDWAAKERLRRLMWEAGDCEGPRPASWKTV